MSAAAPSDAPVPDAPSPVTAPAKAPRLFGRWPIAAGLLTVAVVLQTFAMFWFAEDSTHQKMSVLFIWPATLFGCLLWWLFGTRFSWRVKLTPVAVIAVVCGAFFTVYRIEGSDGDMVPVLAYRWQPTAREIARDYWKQQTVGTAVDVTPAAVEGDEAAAAPTPLVADVDDWPDFRGPYRDGIYRGSEVRLDWDQSPPRELWRHPVGLGWSSFAVLGDYAITLEQRDDQEAVVCYHLQTGEPIWIHGDTTRFTAVAVNGGDGPHTTPAIVGERTVTLGATGILNCLATRTGVRHWSRNILEDAGTPGNPAKNIEWGVSASPLVVDGLVITIPGGTAGRSVIAYHLESGEIAWSTGEFPASYCGARVEELEGVRQLLIYHGTGLTALTIEDGRPLWSFDWVNMPKVNSAQPLKVADDAVVIGSGYGVGAVRVDLDRTDEGWLAMAGWKSTRFKLKFNDAVLLKGFLYGLDDGILTCVDPTSGKTQWKARRFGYGQLLGFEDGRLLILSEDGDAVVVDANPQKFTELARMHVLDGTTWNHPVIAGQKLLVRNGTTAGCYDLSGN